MVIPIFYDNKKNNTTATCVSTTECSKVTLLKDFSNVFLLGMEELCTLHVQFLNSTGKSHTALFPTMLYSVQGQIKKEKMGGGVSI